MLRLDIEKARDDGRSLLPITGFWLKLFSAGRGKPIEARAAVGFRCAPLGSNRAFMLELEQQGIKCALVDSQKVSADLLDATGDSPAVLRPQDIECLKDHQ